MDTYMDPVWEGLYFGSSCAE